MACRTSCEDCVRLSVCLREEERSTLNRSEESPVLTSMLTEPRSMETAAERVMMASRRGAKRGELRIYVADI